MRVPSSPTGLYWTFGSSAKISWNAESGSAARFHDQLLPSPFEAKK